MTTWPIDELRRISDADDLHISPLREDGVTYGTPKQKQVSVLVATDHTNDIARRLNVSVTTVRDHLSKIYDKFGVHDRRELTTALA